jgi:hypothetical protein
MAYSSSGVMLPSRCLLIFDDTNCGEFVAFMHIHIHMFGLRLWGIFPGRSHVYCA